MPASRPSAGSIAIATIAAVVVIPAPAAAAPATGRVMFAVNGGASAVLRAADVKIGARSPATARATKLTFPISTGTVGARTSLNLSGTLRLSTRSRSVTLTKLRLTTGTPTTITALLAGRRTTILVRSARAAKPDVDGKTGDVVLGRASWSLTRRTAATIRARLRLRRLPSGAFATAIVTATVTPKSQTTKTSAGSPTSAGGTGATPPSGGPPTAACNAVGQRVEPPVLSRPGSAVDASPTSINWRVRESFVNYIRTGEGVTASDGASAGATIYDFGFTPQPLGSWRDASSGTALLRYTGTVRFSFSSHGIDIRAKNPEVEINGASSRIIFTIDSAGSANKRAVFANLSLTPSFADMPGSVPAGPEGSELAGFYCPGTPFGSVSVSWT